MCFMFVLILAASMVLGFVSVCVVCCVVVGVWGVEIFVLYVMLVDGGVPLWVECVYFVV